MITEFVGSDGVVVGAGPDLATGAARNVGQGWRPFAW